MKKLKRPAGARRLKSRPGAGRSLKRLLVVLALLVPVVVGLIVWLAFFTDACAVEQVEITGNRVLDDGHIRQLSGVDSYQNLLRVPVGLLERNLERDPWIMKARIGRRLLNTVTIDVDERAPIALIDSGGTGFLVDGSGYVISSAATDQFPGLPRIYAGDIPPPRIAEKVSDASVVDCVRVIESMPKALRDILLMGNPFDGRGQVFISRPGFNIIYGKATDLKKKNEVLEAIVTDISKNNRSVAYIDVRVPDSPAIKPE